MRNPSGKRRKEMPEYNQPRWALAVAFKNQKWEDVMKLRARIAVSVASFVVAALCVQEFAGEAQAASKGKIVAFIISSTNPYIGQWKKGAEAKAKELGYDIKVIENNFNQTEE